MELGLLPPTSIGNVLVISAARSILLLYIILDSLSARWAGPHVLYPDRDGPRPPHVACRGTDSPITPLDPVLPRYSRPPCGAVPWSPSPRLYPSPHTTYPSTPQSHRRAWISWCPMPLEVVFAIGAVMLRRALASFQYPAFRCLHTPKLAPSSSSEPPR